MRDKILYITGAAAILLLARDMYLITGFPAEANQGAIFKIIFFHVPMAITALTCAMVAFIASILFLITKKFQ
jgi:heme exporter protein C